tara:strand:- start:193 stop:339 length:147 start_codon:yes stop_codon:yes gene_type:complete
MKDEQVTNVREFDSVSRKIDVFEHFFKHSLRWVSLNVPGCTHQPIQGS